MEASSSGRLRRAPWEVGLFPAQGAGWVGAEVPHVQRKRHSHRRLRESGRGESPALKRGISFQ